MKTKRLLAGVMSLALMGTIVVASRNRSWTSGRVGSAVNIMGMLNPVLIARH